MKKKILWMGEATFLNTGFAVYGKEVLSRLHATGKYDIAELASYGAPNDPRRFEIPWTYYGNMPTDNSENDAYRAQMENQWGLWRLEHTLLDFKPDIVIDVRDWWMALANGNDIILTQTGFKSVCDIKLGDKVLTHTGGFKSVTHVFNKEYSGTIYKYRCSHVPFSLELTEQHPVLAISRKGLPLPNFTTTKPEWIQSNDLKKGDIVCIPRIPQSVNTKYNQHMSRLIGYYAAEGCVMYNGKKRNNKLKGVQFTLNHQEAALILDINNIIKSQYGLQCSIKYKKDNSCVIRAFSKKLAQDMITICPGLAKTKFVTNPQDINVIQFLCGYFRGDGCTNYSTRRSSCNTVSKNLAIQIFQMCISIGILPSYSYNKNKLKGKIYYRYIFGFYQEAHDSFYNIYHQINTIFQSKRIDDNYAYVTIKTIDTIQSQNIDVYNFEVEEDNSYVSAFTLHNCEFTERSPFRRLFHWAIMPTIDSMPQRDQWLSTYLNADSVCAYSEFGRDTLLKALGSNLKFKALAPPCADYDIWKPAPNKNEAKEKFGIEKDTLIVGTIMRNQKRKLFPDLIAAFKKFLINSPALGKDAFLYLHTGYPDIGWDIPKLLRESEISHKILFTYLCPRCTHVFPSFFQDSIQVCPKCKHPTAVIPGPDAPLPQYKLANIVNCFDIYVQYSTCEGFGMPQLEAAACGVPVMAVNYSAMESVLKNIKGIPIDVERFFLECETHAYRAYPNNDQLAAKLAKFFYKPEHIRQQIGRDTFLACRQHYNWDKTAKVWEDICDEVKPINGWESQPKIIEPNLDIPQDLTNEDFVRWAIHNVWGEPSYTNSYVALRMIRDLNYGQAITGNGGIFHSDDSMLAQTKYRPFNRDMVIEELLKLAQRRNDWERKRVSNDKNVPMFVAMKKGVVK